MSKQIPQTLKGFRDFLPPEMVLRNYIKNIFVEVFEQFGYQPLETPTLEYASTLLGKYGEDADRLVYTFNDRGDRKVGLRYDLTVPVSKVLSIYQNDIQLPFKQYQIQLVWRADKPQKGRYREFIQCEADTFGSSSPTSDAEYVALIYQILKKIGFSKFIVKINSRQVLFELISKSGLEKDKFTVLQSVDKLDKIGWDGVKNELVFKSIPNSKIDQLFEYIKQAQPDSYLQQLLDCLPSLGVPKDYYQFDSSMVRGLDYYTGPIFEVYITQGNMGAVCGGGRFDKLISQLGGPDIPATGIAFGFDRLIDVIKQLNLLPQLPSTTTKILVANFGQEYLSESLKLTSSLRQQNINTTFYPDPDKLGKQFKYASSMGIPYVAILGDEEIKQNKITIKNMDTRDQQLLSFEELVKSLS